MERKRLERAMIRAGLLLGAALAVLVPGGARGHEVLHRVEWSRAAAVQVSFADGEALAYARYEVYSPADPKITHQTGRTDREGWLAFVPTTPGPWRVKVADGSGHGLELVVEAERGPEAKLASSAAVSTAAFVLRPLVGLAAIGAVFAFLYRRRRAPPRF